MQMFQSISSLLVDFALLSFWGPRHKGDKLWVYHLLTAGPRHSLFVYECIVANTLPSGY